MNVEQLRKGQDLVKLIDTTEKALQALKEIKPEHRGDQSSLDDKLYNLSISEYRDGSGKRGELARYYGNERLLKVIIVELEKQLEEFKELFASL